MKYTLHIAGLTHSSPLHYLFSCPSAELSDEHETSGAGAGTGSTEEEGAASTELPSSSVLEEPSGGGVYWGEGQETAGGEAGIAGVDDDGSSDVSGL